MKEIRYRAWDLEEGRMMHVAYIEFDATGDICAVGLHFENRENGDNLYLMQFTGLHDKNGKEIYEGDIVKRAKGNFLRGEGWQEIITPVEYRNGGFCWADWRLDKTTAEQDLEIIGNIYSNPELLK